MSASLRNRFGACRLSSLSRLSAAALAAAAALALSGTLSARTVTDDTGAAVEVPDRIERVAVANILPLASAATVWLGDGSKIVGMHPTALSAAKAGLLGELYPEVLKANASFIQGANLSIEGLMRLNPDVVFVNAGDRRMLERVRAAGLAGFGISPTKWNYDVIRTYEGWMASLHALFPEAKANPEAISERMKHYAELVRERTAEIPEAERKSVLFVVRSDARQIVVSGEKFFGEYWCRAIGAKNAAHSIKAENANAAVTMEEIYAWNPDAIVLTNFTPLLPEDLIEGRDAGRDWSHVKAVQMGAVSKMPLGLYRTFTPSADTPVTLLWLAKTIYPEHFADIDLAAETRRFYAEAFGAELTDEQIRRIFEPSARAAAGLSGSVKSSR